MEVGDEVDSDLPKLLIAPDQNGYGFVEPNSVVFTDTPGGFPRQRLDTPDAPYELQCSWTVKQNDFNYMMRFHRANKIKPFLIDLVIEGVELREYKVVFTPQSFTHDGHSGHTYFISAGLYVLPSNSEEYACFDELMLVLDQCYELRTACLLSDIESLVLNLGGII